jgi:hypothetical protein
MPGVVPVDSSCDNSVKNGKAGLRGKRPDQKLQGFDPAFSVTIRFNPLIPLSSVFHGT